MSSTVSDGVAGGKSNDAPYSCPGRGACAHCVLLTPPLFREVLICFLYRLRLLSGAF